MKIFKFLKKNWLKILFYLMLVIAFMLYIYIFVFMLALLYYFIQIYLIADIGKENNDRSFLLFTALSSLIVWLKYVFESPFSLNSLIKNKTSTEWKDFSKNLIYIFVSNFLSNICFNPPFVLIFTKRKIYLRKINYLQKQVNFFKVPISISTFLIFPLLVYPFQKML